MSILPQSCRDNGCVQIWSIITSKLTSQINLEHEVIHFLQPFFVRKFRPFCLSKLVYSTACFTDGKELERKYLHREEDRILTSAKWWRILTLIFKSTHLVSRFVPFLQTCCMACCPASSTIIIGTGSGHVYFVEATAVENPRILSCVLLHKEPVLHLR